MYIDNNETESIALKNHFIKVTSNNINRDISVTLIKRANPMERIDLIMYASITRLIVLDCTVVVIIGLFQHAFCIFQFRRNPFLKLSYTGIQVSLCKIHKLCDCVGLRS